MIGSASVPQCSAGRFSRHLRSGWRQPSPRAVAPGLTGPRTREPGAIGPPLSARHETATTRHLAASAAMVFGLGGVATDVLGDRAARLTPLTDADADECCARCTPLRFCSATAGRRLPIPRPWPAGQPRPAAGPVFAAAALSTKDRDLRGLWPLSR